MLRKLTVGLLLLALAGATMGQESCSTEPGGDQTSASDTDAADREAARERKREKRRAEKRRAKKRRERERRQREQRVPDPQPEQTEPDPPSDSGSSDCHPSYKGDCLDPSASDYDCAGGSGDGPEYANGPISVVGSDEYDLDRDGDGTACES